MLDLFAGAGGLSTGFRTADERFEIVAAVESDPVTAETCRLNHGDVVYSGTIQDWLAAGDVPAVDVVIGGPPCQGFSTLGKRDADDERNVLWEFYAKALELAQPRYFVMENVPTFLKSPELDSFRERIRAGALSRYSIEERVLNAARHGAAQRRRRGIVIGWRDDVARPEWPVERDVEPTVEEAWQGVPRVVSEVDLPDERHLFGATEVPGPFSSRELHVTRHYRQLSMDRFAAIPNGGNRFDLPDHLKAPCWIKHTRGSTDVMGRLRWEEPSVTIRTEFFKPEKGRYLHPDQPRAITHYEAALLQGFPIDYKWVGSKTSIARQIGNAVPIPLGAALGTSIRDAFDRGSAGAAG